MIVTIITKEMRELSLKMFRKLVFLALFQMTFAKGYSQNLYPENQDVFLDGRSVIYRIPTTTGGWARGNYFENPTGSEYWGGIGLYGSASSPNGIFISHGASPWSSVKGIFIKKSGNVGIGTINPSDLLHISSGSSTVFHLHTESTTDNSIIKFTGRRTSGSNSNHYIGTGGTDNKNFILDIDQDLLIKNNNSISMIVDGIGNVGIGTTTIPSGYKLAVDGHIRTREIRVDQDTWPDYVFTEDYKLPTLEEIKKHIEKKGHLPNMPSAKEVETNGIELGEMNRLLLEKIEEMTLYLLYQEDALKNQQKFNQYLMERIQNLEESIKTTKRKKQ